MSLLESGLVLRFMKGNLGKGSVTHNDHAARNVIFFAVLKSTVRAVFAHLNEVQRIVVLSPITFSASTKSSISQAGLGNRAPGLIARSSRHVWMSSAGGATCSTSATSSGLH